MATPRTVMLGIAVGAIFAAYLGFWLRVVPYFALAAGASALVLILVLAAAFGEDAEVIDRAWRDAEVDRQPNLAGREPGQPTRSEPAQWAQPEPRRADADPTAAVVPGADEG
jgi:hypothetical protein